MLALLTHLPLKLSGTWILEPKYDGQRIIAENNNGKINLWTRRHVDASNKFPEIIKALKKIKGEWVLDGELTMDGGFRQLLNRNVEDPLKIKILSKKIPAKYNVFDILMWDCQDLKKKPLIKRKSVLLKILPEDNKLELVHFQEAENSTIKNVFEEYVQEGYEGIILKDAYSNYFSGKRPGAWLKVKREDTVDVNIIGATKSGSSLTFGALMMEKDGKYFGKVGSGFTDQDKKDIFNILLDNETPIKIDIPEKLKKEILISTKPLPAEIIVNEIYKGSPRAPVWVKFRLD